MRLVLRGGRLFDATGSSLRNLDAISIVDDRIELVGEITDLADDLVIDTSGLTLMPGLIDAHAHLGAVAPVDGTVRSSLWIASEMLKNAELCLMSGFTSVRDLAGADGALADLIQDGSVVGPRVYPSGAMLVSTGGHGDFRCAFDDRHAVDTPGLSQAVKIVDGPDAVRHAVRNNFRHGATQIKVAISGGVNSRSDKLEDLQFSVEELEVAVAEAVARGTYVTGHAMTAESVRHGLRAGLKCFEHAIFLDEETVAMLLAADASIVPTLAVSYLLAHEGSKWGVLDSAVERAAGLYEQQLESLRMAYDAGVRIGSGADLVGTRQGRWGLEVALKSEVIGVAKAVESATRVNAEILGLSESIGTVEPGKLADVIGVAGDPFENPRLFDDPDNVRLVVKDGRIVKDTRTWTRPVSSNTTLEEQNAQLLD